MTDPESSDIRKSLIQNIGTGPFFVTGVRRTGRKTQGKEVKMACARPRARRERSQPQRLDAQLSKDKTDKRELVATKLEVGGMRKALKAVDDFIIAELEDDDRRGKQEVDHQRKLAMAPN